VVCGGMKQLEAVSQSFNALSGNNLDEVLNCNHKRSAALHVFALRPVCSDTAHMVATQRCLAQRQSASEGGPARALPSRPLHELRLSGHWSLTPPHTRFAACAS
jgi:hypothetical protein